MLPLPHFEYLAPPSLDEAVRALAERPGESLLVAGGTDVLPAMKLGLCAPRRLVSLARVAELRGVERDGAGGLRVGAAVTLDTLARDAAISANWPALAEAAGSAASPQLRRMGTLGGNLCLDTRCGYYDQSAFWRGALGGCLKLDGDTCHVVAGGQKCVAALSADTPAPLIGYQAEVTLVSTRGTRTLPLARFYAGDGVRHTAREPDEILVDVRLPPPPPGQRSAYGKLRARQAIDFPLLSVATVCELDDDGRTRALRVVVGALGALPRQVRGLEAIVVGRMPDATTLDAVAAAAHAQCHPLGSLGAASWRQAVVATQVRRTLAAMR